MHNYTNFKDVMHTMLHNLQKIHCFRLAIKERGQAFLMLCMNSGLLLLFTSAHTVTSITMEGRLTPMSLLSVCNNSVMNTLMVVIRLMIAGVFSGADIVIKTPSIVCTN